MTKIETCVGNVAGCYRSGTDTVSPSGVGTPLAIIAVISVAVGLRPGIVSVGPVLPAIIAEFHLSHTAASLLTAIPDILMGLLALPSPWLARRFGRDAVMLAALCILFASLLGRTFATGPIVLFVTTAGVGAGIAIAGTLMGGFIKARFASSAAWMMGIYATALSLGSTVSAALTAPIAMAQRSGWRLAVGIWCLLVICGFGGWLMIALSEQRPVPDVATRTTMARLPIRNAAAWLIALYFACDNFLFYGLLSWTFPMYREAGKSEAVAGLILASFTAAFMIANPVSGWSSRKRDRRGPLTLFAILTAAGIIGTAMAPRLAPFLFIPLSAFGLGGAFTLAMTLPLDNTESVDEANTWSAFVLTIGYLIAAAGPLLVGWMRDLTGSFRSAMWLLALVSVAMLCIAPFLAPQDQDVSTG